MIFKNVSSEKPPHGPSPFVNEDELYKCVHCGFCLQACPTYLQTGLETESPRGRLALMKAVNEDRIAVDETVTRHWDLCIQCRACEAACPSGVPYGSLIESVMFKVQDQRKNSILKKLSYEILLKRLIPRKRLLNFLGLLTVLYVSFGLQKVVRYSKILFMMPELLRSLDDQIPKIYGKSFKANNQVYVSQDEQSKDLYFLSGCIMPIFQGDQMRSAVSVLNRNGFDVIVPSNQVCCGAINSHAGDLETASNLAKKNIDAFGLNEEIPIVTMSAGCGARLKGYHELLRDDLEYSERSLDFVARIKDVHELLGSIKGVEPLSDLKLKVTYQDSCHLANVQGIKQEPRDLIKGIGGVEFVELPNSGICCGAGGTYMITEQQMSGLVLKSKIKDIKSTGATVVATANPGCFMQLENGIRQEGLDVEVKYITDLLEEGYRKE